MSVGNMIGAIGRRQPFGGEDSRALFKAGGGTYLVRFCSEQTVTINTAAGVALAPFTSAGVTGQPGRGSTTAESRGCAFKGFKRRP
jgi:delta 1-pyrroline-5-carboxylate dehydrogenase